VAGKVSITDAFITVGAFILALAIYQRVKPVISYASTQLVAEEVPFGGLMDVEQCSKLASKKCCRQAEYEGQVSEDAANACHLCNHPNCDEFQTTGPAIDPTIPPFQVGSYKIKQPESNYAVANQATARAYRVSYY